MISHYPDANDRHEMLHCPDSSRNAAPHSECESSAMDPGRSVQRRDEKPYDDRVALQETVEPSPD